MSKKRPTTIAEYIAASPPQGQALLRELYAILKSEAPDAREVIKWGTPFFVEPRFLFAFSAHKAHINFAPSAAVLKAFSKELQKHQTTENFLQIPYNQPLPEKLIRRMAKQQLKLVSKRKDDNFW